MIGMNILFREYESMTASQAVSIFIGFGVLCCAVFLLQAFKELPLYHLSDIKKLKQRNDQTIADQIDTTV